MERLRVLDVEIWQWLHVIQALKVALQNQISAESLVSLMVEMHESALLLPLGKRFIPIGVTLLLYGLIKIVSDSFNQIFDIILT